MEHFPNHSRDVINEVVYNTLVGGTDQESSGVRERMLQFKDVPTLQQFTLAVRQQWPLMETAYSLSSGRFNDFYQRQ